VSARGAIQAARLALADFRFDARVSACLVLALAAVMTPLLVLFGLKYGMISTLQERLLADPANREIVVVGSQRLAPEWFESLRAASGVDFLAPRSRSLSATLDVRGPEGAAYPGLEMVPSAAGDPLLPAGAKPPQGSAVWLTAAAAQRLGARTGDTLAAQVARTLGGETQVARFPLTVAGVLPETAFGRAAAFVAVDLLLATEDYRDGYTAPRLGTTHGTARPASPPRVFAGLRLYARGLDDVAPLAERLRSQGMEVRTRAAEIENVRAIDRVLSLIVLVIAAIGATGFLLSLGASLWANVERKRRDLALMRLIGFSPRDAALFPAVQGALVAVLGTALSGVVYLGVSAVFDLSLGANLGANEFVTRMPPGRFAFAAIVTLAAALAAAAFAGRRAARVDPAESLRDV